MGDRLAVIQSEVSIEELKLVNIQLTKTIKLFDDLIKKSDELNSLFAKGTPKEYMEGMGKLSDLMTRLAKAEKDLIDISAKYEVINKAVSKSTENKRKALSDLDKQTEKHNKLQGEEYAATNKVRVANEELTKELKKKAQADLLAQGKLNASLSLYRKTELALNSLVRRYNELAIKKELGNKLTDKEESRMANLQKTIVRYDTALKAVDATVGKNQRNVGNYKSGFNELGNSVNQLSREMPAFANSVQTGFMAISNNLPIFFDAIGNIRKENAALRAEGKPTVSTFKQIAGSIFSLGTVLSIGVTLLTIYGKDMYEWAKAVLAGSQASQNAKKNIEDLNKAKSEGLKSAASEISQLKILYRVSTDVSLSTEQRMRAVRKLQDLYPSYFGNMTAESIMLGKATKQYKELAGAIIASAQARGIENILTERMEKSLLAQEEQQNKLNEAIKEANVIRKNGRSETQTVSDGQGGLIRKEIGNQVLLSRAMYKVGVLRNGLKKIADDEAKANETLIRKQIELQNQAAKYESDKYGKDAPKDKVAKGGLSKEQKDYLDSLIAIRDTEIAIAKEKQVNGIFDEKQYWERYIQVVKTYRQKVSDYLNGANGQQRKIEASVRRRGIEEISKANKEIFDYEKEQLESRYKMRQEVIERKLNEINNNEYDFEIDKIQQRNYLYNEQIADTAKFYDDLLKSAVKYSQEYIAIEAKRDDEIGKLQDKQSNNNANSPQALKEKIDYLRQIEDLYREASNIEEKTAIIANSKLRNSEKEYFLAKLSVSQNRESYALEIKRLESDILTLKAKKLQTNEDQKQLAILEKQLSVIKNNNQGNENEDKQLDLDNFKNQFSGQLDYIKQSLSDFGLENMSKTFDKVFDDIWKLFDGTLDKTEAWKTATILAATAVADAFTMMSNHQKEKTIANLDEQLKYSQDTTEQEIGFINQRLEMLNAIQDKTVEQTQERNALEDEARVLKEQQAQREKMIATKKAKAEQKAAAQQALINGLLAATMALATQAPPASYVMAAISAGMGIAMAATIMSKNPVPQYYVGTDNAIGGMAWTQERGAEIITDKNDNVKSYGNNRGAQLTMLDPGDKVYTAGETKSIMADFPKPNWGKIATDSVYMPVINIPKEKIDYDLLADKMGSKFEAVFKKYDKPLYQKDENGDTIYTVGNRLPEKRKTKQPKPTIIIQRNVRD